MHENRINWRRIPQCPNNRRSGDARDSYGTESRLNQAKALITQRESTVYLSSHTIPNIYPAHPKPKKNLSESLEKS